MVQVYFNEIGQFSMFLSGEKVIGQLDRHFSSWLDSLFCTV